MPSHHEASETYRLIITRRNATEILLLPNGTDWVLPQVEIRKHQRVAEQLTAEARKSTGLETGCLLVPDAFSPDQNDGAMCAVLECVKHEETAPAESRWIPVNVATEGRNAGEAEAVKDAFAELASYTSGDKPGPFAKPGWMVELFRWASEQTAPLGLRLTCNFQQFNASPTFSLLRLETNGSALWFKAVGEPNAHELPITVLLAQLFREYVPRILGVHTSWNGWLSAEVQGTPLDELTECSAWEHAAESLAELQIESMGRSTELVEGQCKDMRLLEVEKHIAPFLSRMNEFMRVQEKNSPAPLNDGELASLGDGLRESSSVLRSFGFPDTIGHLDCNPGNILLCRERCVFLDWAEACVTNPVITFEYLRRHLLRTGVDTRAADSRITAAYLRPWASFFAPEDLRRAIAVVPPVAAFVYAVGNDTWRTLDPASNPTLAGYFRSLTRRMHCDAVLAAERSERCLN
jgi:hypothetical protein